MNKPPAPMMYTVIMNEFHDMKALKMDALMHGYMLIESDLELVQEKNVIMIRTPEEAAQIITALRHLFFSVIDAPDERLLSARADVQNRIFGCREEGCLACRRAQEDIDALIRAARELERERIHAALLRLERLGLEMHDHSVQGICVDTNGSLLERAAVLEVAT